MRFVKTGAVSKLKTATDGQLFVLMAQRGSDAKEAWAEFYTRHVTELYHLVHRLQGVSASDIESLVQDTMLQAWNAARTFEADDTLCAEASRNRTLAWLGRIAQNLYFAIRRREKITLTSRSDEEKYQDESSPASMGRKLIPRGELHLEIRAAEARIEGAPDVHEESESTEARLLRQALESLPEREREILMTTYEYREYGKEHQRLPQEVIDELCGAYNISPQNLRKIRERAYKEVVEFLDKHRTA